MKKGSRLYSVLFGVIVVVALAGTFWPRSVITRNGEIRSQQAKVLTGQEASDYLSQDKDGQSLMRAVTAARFNVRPQEEELGRDRPSAYLARNTEHDFTAFFEADSSVQVRSNGDQKWQIGLRLKSYGYGEQVVEVPPIVSRQVSGSRIEYHREDQAVAIAHLASRISHPALTEWYVNKPDGLEQGFTLPAPPRDDRGAATSSPNLLRLTMEWTGDLEGELTADGQAMLLKDAKGQKVASYNHLKAWDATGRELAARLQVSGREVSLEVNDAGAKYPVTIDPTLQGEVKLTALGGVAKEELGWSVAISGNTAIVGVAPKDGNDPAIGAAYIFVRNGADWVQEAKLIAGGNNGGRRDYFGAAVAISGDLAVVGDTNAYTDDGSFFGRLGAAFVFVRGAGVWSLEKKLLADQKVGNDQFGYAVAISGEKVVIGAPWDDVSSSVTYLRGAVYVFDRNGGSWTQQPKLVPSDGVAGDQFGRAVAISGDYAIIGAPYHNDADGAAYIFHGGGTGWFEQAILTGFNATQGEGFGYSVSISGNTAVAGVLHDTSRNSNLGAAYTFVRNDTSWPKEQTLVGDSTADRFFGYSVAISNDLIVVGDPFEDQTALVLPGQAYLFGRKNGIWTQQRRLTASDAASHDAFGFSVAINVSGQEVIGAPGHDVGGNTNQGQAYVLALPDTDGDGLPDDWEKNGVTIDGVKIDLPAMGANVNHKDLFIHIDWMAKDPGNPQSNFKPDSRAIQMVIDAFAIAPDQNNPDGKEGINLHVDFGPTSVMKYVEGTAAPWGDLSRAGEVGFQATIEPNVDGTNWSEVDVMKMLRFAGNKRDAVFHYVLYCKNFGKPDRPDNGGVTRSTPGSDSLIGVSGWRTPTRSPLMEAGIFMHEIGHNLGLHHGGDDEVTDKPNYLSVMNYLFTPTGPLYANGQQSIDYSRRVLDTLDETNLSELNGINDPDVHLTRWSKNTLSDDPAGTNQCLQNPDYNKFLFPSLDWNCDGTNNATPVMADLNDDGVCVAPRDPNSVLHTVPAAGDSYKVVVIGNTRATIIVSGPDHKCDTPATPPCDPNNPALTECDIQVHPQGYLEPAQLKGFRDWPALVFNGGSIGSFAATPVAQSEASARRPTAPVALETAPKVKERTMDEILANVPAALLAAQDAAPLDVVAISPQPDGVTFVFDGGASVAIGGTIVQWDWTFGDSKTGTGSAVTHTYDIAGEYLVTLTVTDSNGHVNLVPLLNRVNAKPKPTPTPTPTPTPAGPLPGRRITKVADTTDGFPGSLSVTTINNSRTLVFAAQRADYIGLFTKTADGPLQDVADFNALGGPPDGLWTINEAGQVGFMTRPGQTGFPNSSDRFKIYRSDGGVVTKLAETTPFGPAGTFATFSTTFVSINDSGTVSFWAQLNGGGSALYRVDSAGTLSTAVDTKNGFFTSFYADARMNQSGVIAFGATTTTGLGIFTVAPDGTLSTIVTRPSDFEGFGGGPAINSAGTVAFLGQTQTISGVFTGKGGALTTIAQASREFGTTDPFLDFTGVPAINDAGTVVFQARLRSAPENRGIFTGPNFVSGKIDPTAVDKVIAIGDSLFGSTVETLYFNGALNQNGDIAFSYGLKNRIEGVAFASPPPTGLANISTRLRVQPGDNALIGGFIITGTEPKKVLLRAIAPSLSVPGKLEDTTIELFNSSGQVIRTNDNWGDSDDKPAIIASTIPPVHNLESAILVNLDPGAYTAIVRGVNNTTGIGVVEAYDLDRTADSKLANISSRGVVETGDDVMIGGFIIVGSKLQKVIVRAIGPSLSVAQKLSNPTLELRDSNGALLRSNDDWRSDQEAEIIATTIPPTNNSESALVISLSPSPYTAIVRGVNDTTGIAVVEVYALE